MRAFPHPAKLGTNLETRQECNFKVLRLIFKSGVHLFFVDFSTF